MFIEAKKMNTKENISLFLEYFGDTPQLRVMDFLIENHFFDYPMTEIARGANVSYNSFQVFFPKLIESKMLIPTRKIGKSDYFKLNIEHPFIKKLIQLDWALTTSSILGAESEEQLEKQISIS